MKYYISIMNGSVYKLENGQLYFTAIFNDTTFNTEDFTPVEKDLIGEELTSSGITFSKFYEEITKLLSK